MDFAIESLRESWQLLLDASVYILFGLLFAGLLRMAISPAKVARHLGEGRFWPVFKAALFGIPLPLCSCAVLPAAAALRKQGANKGATVSFLISTPESGVDSIAISWALLDPTLTVARPLAALATATAAGLAENLVEAPGTGNQAPPDLSCPVDHCCDGTNCSPYEHAHHHRLGEKVVAGLRHAFGDLWGDLAGWFAFGLVLAGAITALVPEGWVSGYLGGGIGGMLLMLAVSIPLYICASASTPVAAALILKGVSPGTALILLLAGPATNPASLTVLWGFLGKRATAIYLACIAIMSLGSGLLVDRFYAWAGIEASATVRQATEIIPIWGKWLGAMILVAVSIRPLWEKVRGWNRREAA
ncbi:MAG: SO_0444 family Cu/Zn efflux transporter [Bradymonadales bacterium]|nr:SO_0444 family Cu/Zn efflux transporter [Bradymonadales bacterium]